MTEHSIAAGSPAFLSETEPRRVAANDIAAEPFNDRSDPAFEASLLYLAADLSEIARTAPPEKQASLVSVINLLRALAVS